MIAIGPDDFARFLDGAAAMDAHFRTAPEIENLPVMLALTGIWHRQVCGHPTRAVLPYDQRLALLPTYLQQLEMESNGKRVGIDGADLAHDVAVAFDDEFLGRAHGADPGHAAHVVAAQIQQHQVLGQFLRIGQQVGLVRAVLFRRGPAGPGARDGSDRDLPVKDAHQDLGAGADHLKAAEVEIEHESRG